MIPSSGGRTKKKYMTNKPISMFKDHIITRGDLEAELRLGVPSTNKLIVALQKAMGCTIVTKKPPTTKQERVAIFPFGPFAVLLHCKVVRDGSPSFYAAKVIVYSVKGTLGDTTPQKTKDWSDSVKNEYTIAHQLADHNIGISPSMPQEVQRRRGGQWYSHSNGKSVWILTHRMMDIYDTSLERMLYGKGKRVVSVLCWVEKHAKHVSDTTSYRDQLAGHIRKLIDLGYVHTDINTANILINVETGTLVIADFGVNSIQQIRAAPLYFKRIQQIWMWLKIVYQQPTYTSFIYIREWFDTIVKEEFEATTFATDPEFAIALIEYCLDDINFNSYRFFSDGKEGFSQISGELRHWFEHDMVSLLYPCDKTPTRIKQWLTR
jgi:serine/threonine protein kinase